MELMNYGPNSAASANMTKQTVRLTFGLSEYRKVVDVVVGGCCKGFSVIESAINGALAGLYGDNDIASITLESQEKGTLRCEDECDRQENWLQDMLISAEILSIIPAGGFPGGTALNQDFTPAR